MGKMSKESAKLFHLKGRRQVLEEQLVNVAEQGDALRFAELSRDLDTIEFRIEVQQNYMTEGFNTRVKNTTTVPSSVGNYISLL